MAPCRRTSEPASTKKLTTRKPPSLGVKSFTLTRAYSISLYRLAISVRFLVIQPLPLTFHLRLPNPMLLNIFLPQLALILAPELCRPFSSAVILLQNDNNATFADSIGNVIRMEFLAVLLTPSATTKQASREPSGRCIRQIAAHCATRALGFI